MLDFSIGSLFAGFVFGVIGMWALKEGRKRSNTYWILIAIAMFVYTYFTNSIYLDWGLGFGLCYLLYHFRNH